MFIGILTSPYLISYLLFVSCRQQYVIHTKIKSKLKRWMKKAIREMKMTEQTTVYNYLKTFF